MKSIHWRLALVAFVLLLTQCLHGSEVHHPKIRILLVTGGHDFEREQFFRMFETNSEITFRAIEHTNMAPLLKPDAAREYDVLVLYDLWQDISEDMKSDFVALLKGGKGLVVLHHAIGSYQKWPEYRRIIGGRYYLEKDIVDGVEKEPNSFQHGRHFKISVADPHHPVTEGINDFEMHDETYKGFDHTEDVHPLLTTDDPESSQVIAWSKTYEKSRVVYIESGHDHYAWDNPNYQRLLRQAIRWTSPGTQATAN
jgi:type 1 glutamine amidotransferase